jgi:hypothetical protein
VVRIGPTAVHPDRRHFARTRAALLDEAGKSARAWHAAVGRYAVALEEAVPNEMDVLEVQEERYTLSRSVRHKKAPPVPEDGGE